MFDKEVFYGNLKRLRQERGISSAQFADAISMSRSSVTRWNKGERLPSIDVLWRIADYFDVSLDELVGRSR